MLLSEEVEKCFQENPDLIGKSLKEIALFFMVQGEVRFSLLRSTLNHKANFMYCRLRDRDAKAAEKALKDWKSVSEVYGEGVEE